MSLLHILLLFAPLAPGFQLLQADIPKLATQARVNDKQPDREAEISGGDWQPSDDEWVIFDALAEHGLYHTLKTEVVTAGKHKKCGPGSERSWAFGAHHKSGTNLLRHLAFDQARMMNVTGCYDLGKFGETPAGCPTGGERMWFSCALTIDLLGGLSRETHGNMRAVHIIRDPLAMVISGYIYHIRSNDMPRELLHIRNLTLGEGLEVEAKYHLRTILPKMLRTFEMADREKTLHVKLESFMRSSQSFDDSVEAVYNFTIGDMTDRALRETLQQQGAQWDLRRHPLGPENDHVAPAKAKRIVEEAVASLWPATSSSLERFRRALGYS